MSVSIGVLIVFVLNVLYWSELVIFYAAKGIEDKQIG